MNVPFPLIIPIDEENKIYRGYLPIKDQEYSIQVQLGPRGQIFGTKELNELMNDQKKLIKTKLHEATDIMVFLSELKETLESTHTLKVNAFQPVSTRLSHIYQEISMVGFDKVQSMNETMDEIIFNTRDEKGRDHALKVTLPINYPFVVPQIVAHLPVSIEISPSIATLVRQHEQIVHRYQNVFNCLDELDQHMKVVDPENPKRDEMWRKIALGHHCSLHLEIVNPLLPFDKPQIMLFGGEKRVGDLRKAWERAAWNKEISLYANLMNIFQLVSNESAEKEDYTNTTDIECGICYSYKLENGEAPETICKLCHRGYHSICLYHWLRSNPTTTQSFNTLFGNCPYCNEKITIKAII